MILEYTYIYMSYTGAQLDIWLEGGHGEKIFGPPPLNIFRRGGKKNVCYT